MRESRRLKLVISYDGRDFAGWQSQKHRNTVQDHLEAAFESVCGTRLPVTGSGRTDSGVHALGRCAHVDVPAAQFSAERWLESAKRRAVPSDSDFAGGICGEKLSRSIFGKGQSLPLPDYKRRSRAAAQIGRAWHVPSPLIGSCLGKRPNYSPVGMISPPLPQIAEKKRIPCARSIRSGHR